MRKILIFTTLFASLYAEVITFIQEVPVYRNVEVERVVSQQVPRQECWEEEVPVQSYSQGGAQDTLGAIIGGTAGGILGNQIGKGGGKTAALVGGAILGSIIGQNLAQREPQPPSYRKVRRCKTIYQNEEKRVVEYKNYARVMGKEIVKYSSSPLRSIPVKITLEY